jgi:hypothetical protein
MIFFRLQSKLLRLIGIVRVHTLLASNPASTSVGSVYGRLSNCSINTSGEMEHDLPGIREAAWNKKPMFPDTYLRSLAIPNSLQVNPKHCIEVVRSHLSCRRQRTTNSGSVKAGIQSSETSHRLLNCGLDLVLFTAVCFNIEYFDGRVELNDFGFHIC